MGANNIQRAVFQTELEDQNGDAKIAGVLELALTSADGQVTQKVICYRSFEGEIQDITELVNVSVASSDSFKLTKSAGQNPPYGFDITVQSPMTKQGSLTGTFTQKEGAGPLKWIGRFSCFRDTSLDVIREGPKPIPADVVEFLNITPIVNAKDGKELEQVGTWADHIYQDLLLHALPASGRNMFFKKLGNLGDRFSREDLQGKPLPESVGASSHYPFLSLQQNLQDNHLFLSAAAMHLLCSELKKADWLSAKYRDRIVDNTEQWLQAFASTGSGTNMVYPPGFVPAATVATIFGISIKQYWNSVVRAYYAAYVTLRPELEKFFPKAEEFYQQVKATVLSQTYMEHFLPTLINRTEAVGLGKIPLAIRLAMLRDKMALLKYIASNGADSGQEDIASIIKTLADAAKDTGLLRETNIEIDIKKMDFGVHALLDPKVLQSAQWALAFNPAAAGGFVIVTAFMNAFQNQEVHMFLLMEAKPLGLYNWSDWDTVGDAMNPIGNLCVIS